MFVLGENVEAVEQAVSVVAWLVARAAAVFDMLEHWIHSQKPHPKAVVHCRLEFSSLDRMELVRRLENLLLIHSGGSW